MKRSPTEYLRTLWYDSCVYDPRALQYLAETVGADRIVLGTDYPVGDRKPAEFIASCGFEPRPPPAFCAAMRSACWRSEPGLFAYRGARTRFWREQARCRPVRFSRREILSAAALASIAPSQARAAMTVTDSAGRAINLPARPPKCSQLAALRPLRCMRCGRTPWSAGPAACGRKRRLTFSPQFATCLRRA